MSSCPAKKAELAAPAEDGGILAEPPLETAASLLAENRDILDAAPLSLFGRPLAELRREARQSAVSAAADYLREAGESPPPFHGSSLLMAGHQPELFHPGVWVKNFALHGLARAHGAISINLIVDNDTAKSAAVSVPLRSAEPPPVRVKPVPFDRWPGEIPYEEWAVSDEDVFTNFPDAVAPVMQEWGIQPLLPRLWAEALRRSSRTPLVGERLAAGRRAVERSWGCHNLELPVSRLCDTPIFHAFVCHLLSDLPRFHQIHNGCLRDYRRRYRVRSRSHPVPELTADGPWLEAPFWVWSPDDPLRRRPMARITSKGIELRIDGLTDRLDFQGTQQTLRTEWRFKIRPRALTNTLFARVFLADLFIHGIGGAKYDRLTDDILSRFYGIQPPRLLTLSGTLRLPLPAFPVEAEDRRRLLRHARDIQWNPQCYLSDNSTPQVLDLVRQKEQEIDGRPRTRQEGRRRCRNLRALTMELRPWAENQHEGLQQQLQECDQYLQANSVLRRRDYAFCLFPEPMIRDFCQRQLHFAD
jgi:hypothetical protein